jgi:P-type Ca2+ transporter type 2C
MNDRSEPFDAEEVSHVPMERVLENLGTNSHTGLPASVVKHRLSLHGPNSLGPPARASIFNVLGNQLLNPVVGLLAGAALLALLLEEPFDAAAISAVVIINSIIGFVMELKASRSMESLGALVAQTAVVRRDGGILKVPANELVPGDIVLLEAGDVIAADMRLISSSKLSVDESMLTGESAAVEKGNDAPLLFKGCHVITGSADAVVTATGLATSLGRIKALTERAKPERSPLEQQLAKLSRDLLLATLLLTMVVGASGVLAGHDLKLMVNTGIALAAAAIPEGLPIVATLALAAGMLRLARKKALVRRLAAVETLGSATLILTDKTGTLTENRQQVARVVTAGSEFEFDANGGTFRSLAHDAETVDHTELRELLLTAALCNAATLDPEDNKHVGDPIEVAILVAADAIGLSRPELLDEYPVAATHAFDATIRMMATVHGEDAMRVAVKGAPEAVFASVSGVFGATKTKPFTGAERKKWEARCEALAGSGFRLLAVAGKAPVREDDAPYRDLTLYGVLAFNDPPRPMVESSIAEARRAGIKVVMATGDHAATASYIAKSIGILDDSGPVTEGRNADFDRDPESLIGARVLARFSPEQKLKLVTLHQKAGEIVAMTGDGVNDAPALKKADIGVAMGLRGTQVACEASDIVLQDDSFSTIVEAIRGGRVIFTNIRRFAVYLLSCNLSEILVIGVAAIAGLPLPLLPIQVLFLNLVTDGFPALALGMVKSDEDALDKPPRPPGEPILTRRHWWTIVVSGLMLAATSLLAQMTAAYVFMLDAASVSTVCFMTLALSQLWQAFSATGWRAPLAANPVMRSGLVWSATAVSLAAIAVAYLVPAAAGVLRLVALPASMWIVVFCLSLLPLLLSEACKFARRVRRKTLS